MNCTNSEKNENTDAANASTSIPNPNVPLTLPALRERCRQLGIQLYGDETELELVYVVQQCLDVHNEHPGAECGPYSGDYFEWKQTHDALNELFYDVRALRSASVRSVSSANGARPDSVGMSRLYAAQEPNALDSQAGNGIKTEPTPNYTRTESEPKADQSRTGSEPFDETEFDDPSFSTSSTSPHSSAEKNGPQNSEPVEPNRPNSQAPNPFQSTKKSDNPSHPQNKTEETQEERRARLREEISKMSVEETQAFLAKAQLPDPKKAEFKDYAEVYFDIYGPPPRVHIDKLPAEEQRYILALMEELSLKKTQDKLSLPPPFGPYKAVSKSALRRFRIRHHTLEARRNQTAIRKQINQVLTQPDMPDADFTRVTEQLLKLRLIESSLNPDPDLTQTKTLIEMLEKIRAGKLAERKIALAESKL